MYNGLECQVTQCDSIPRDDGEENYGREEDNLVLPASKAL